LNAEETSTTLLLIETKGVENWGANNVVGHQGGLEAGRNLVQYGLNRLGRGSHKFDRVNRERNLMEGLDIVGI